MKKKLLLCVFSIGLLAYSCGESVPEVDETLVKETLQLEDDIDAINEEIEELNIADADLENALDDLGDLLEE